MKAQSLTSSPSIHSHNPVSAFLWGRAPRPLRHHVQRPTPTEGLSSRCVPAFPPHARPPSSQSDAPRQSLFSTQRSHLNTLTTAGNQPLTRPSPSGSGRAEDRSSPPPRASSSSHSSHRPTRPPPGKRTRTRRTTGGTMADITPPLRTAPLRPLRGTPPRRPRRMPATPPPPLRRTTLTPRTTPDTATRRPTTHHRQQPPRRRGRSKGRRLSPRRRPREARLTGTGTTGGSSSSRRRRA